MRKTIIVISAIILTAIAGIAIVFIIKGNNGGDEGSPPVPNTPVYHKITVIGGTASHATAQNGQTVTLTVDDEAFPEGKIFNNWTVESGNVAIVDNSFVMAESDVVIKAEYVALTFTITASCNEYGSINPSGETIVEYGDTLRIDVLPNDRCRFLSQTVDGEVDTNKDYYKYENYYEFKNITSNHSIEILFEAVPQYKLTVYNGTGEEYVYEGESATVIAKETPHGENFSGWYDNPDGYGRKLSGDKSYTFTMPNREYEIFAVFSTQSFSVNLPKSAAFTILPIQDSFSPVLLGGLYSFKIELKSGYDAESLIVYSNGQVLTPIDSVYTVEDIFEIIDITIDGLTLKTYSITLTETTGINYHPQSELTVDDNSSFKFSIDLDEAYSDSQFIVKANGVVIYPNNFNVYTIYNISANQTVTVEDVELNTYKISYLTKLDGFEYVSTDSLIQNHGASYSFSLNILSGYSAANLKVFSNGIELQLNSGKYVIENITANQAISISGVYAEIYSVSLKTPQTNFTLQKTVGSEYLVSRNAEFSFYIILNSAYSESQVIVASNGIILSPEKDELNKTIYVIRNIQSNQLITVSGLNINTYTITAPNNAAYRLEWDKSIKGKLDHGSNYSFKVALTAKYNKSNIEVLLNGNEIFADENGYYYINNLSDNIEIAIINLAVNTYDILFEVSGNGRVQSYDAEELRYITYVNNQTITLVHGDTMQFAFEVSGGYAIESVKLNGEYMGVLRSIDIISISKDYVLSVKFVDLPANTYTVFVKNGTVNHSSAALGTEITVNKMETPEGTEFIGWFNNEDGTGQPLSTSQTFTFTLSAANYLDVFVAVFKVKSFKINLTDSKGLIAGNSNITVKYGSTIYENSLPECILDGYIFEGWSVNGTTVASDSYKFTAEIMLYAIYSPIKPNLYEVAAAFYVNGISYNASSYLVLSNSSLLYEITFLATSRNDYALSYPENITLDPLKNTIQVFARKGGHEFSYFVNIYNLVTVDDVSLKYYYNNDLIVNNIVTLEAENNFSLSKFDVTLESSSYSYNVESLGLSWGRATVYIRVYYLDGEYKAHIGYKTVFVTAGVVTPYIDEIISYIALDGVMLDLSLSRDNATAETYVLNSETQNQLRSRNLLLEGFDGYMLELDGITDSITLSDGINVFTLIAKKDNLTYFYTLYLANIKVCLTYDQVYEFNLVNNKLVLNDNAIKTIYSDGLEVTFNSPDFAGQFSINASYIVISSSDRTKSFVIIPIIIGKQNTDIVSVEYNGSLISPTRSRYEVNYTYSSSKQNNLAVFSIKLADSNSFITINDKIIKGIDDDGSYEISFGDSAYATVYLNWFNSSKATYTLKINSSSGKYSEEIELIINITTPLTAILISNTNIKYLDLFSSDFDNFTVKKSFVIYEGTENLTMSIKGMFFEDGLTEKSFTIINGKIIFSAYKGGQKYEFEFTVGEYFPQRGVHLLDVYLGGVGYYEIYGEIEEPEIIEIELAVGTQSISISFDGFLTNYYSSKPLAFLNADGTVNTTFGGNIKIETLQVDDNTIHFAAIGTYNTKTRTLEPLIIFVINYV